MAARALFTTTQTARAIFSSPVTNAFATTNTPFQVFVSTPDISAFVATNTPFQAFVTTFGPQETYDLTLVPAITSQSSDCTLITFQDDTGEYPESESGYQPVDGDNDLPDRARRNQVQLWAVFQSYFLEQNEDGSIWELTNNRYNPPVQNNSDPWSFSWSPSSENIFRMYLIGAPLDQDWANWQPRLDIIEVAQTTPNWFISELVFTVDCEINNCVNDTRRRLVDAAMCGKCKTKEWQDKRALQISYLYNLALANTNPITPQEKQASDQFIFKAALIRFALRGLCRSQECMCNCSNC
jgi:hypothetical protein